MQPIKTFWLEPTGKEEKDGSVTRPIYRRADTGKEETLHSAPLGAMVDAKAWYPGVNPGPDGRVIVVKLPENADGSGWSTWCIDAKPTSPPTAQPWQRSGQLPNITVRPSIFMNPSSNPPGFHGFLRSGYIVSVTDPQWTEEACAELLSRYLAVNRSPGPPA